MMRNSFAIGRRAILFCLVSAASLAPLADADAQEAKKSPKATLVRAARLVDVKVGKILEDRGVWIEGDRIKEVGPIADVRKHAPRDVEEIDLNDVTILPGLIDCHTHLLTNFSKEMGDDTNMLLAVAQLGTTRAPCSAWRWRERTWRRASRQCATWAIRASMAMWPCARRSRPAGSSGRGLLPPHERLSAVGGQFGNLVPEAQKLIEQEYVAISGVEEARRAVRQAFYDGADCIKVIVDTGPRMLSLDELKVIVEETHRVKKKVAAHVASDQAARIAALAGVDSIEHAYTVPDDVLKIMADKHIFLVPTDFPAVESYATPPVPAEMAAGIQRFIDANHDRLRRAIKLGVPIATGSDTYFQTPGKSARPGESRDASLPCRGRHDPSPGPPRGHRRRRRVARHGRPDWLDRGRQVRRPDRRTRQPPRRYRCARARELRDEGGYRRASSVNRPAAVPTGRQISAIVPATLPVMGTYRRGASTSRVYPVGAVPFGEPRRCSRGRWENP